MKVHARLLPLFAYYLIVILVGSRSGFEGDETFYLRYARDLWTLLTGGDGALDLGTGPGYSLTLIPLTLLDVPPLWGRLLNAVWLFGAVAYVHATLREYLPPRAAFRWAALFGVYPPLLKESFFLLSEGFAMFLMCGFVYHYCRSHRPDARVGRHVVAAACFAGWLILTKVFYSYVFVALLLAGGGLWAAGRRGVGRRAVGVSALALALCVPYLTYTYGATGRVFYWAYTGGEALYWMSTPYPGEYGEWHPSNFRDIERLRTNHGDVFAALPDSRQEREPGLRRAAMENIRAHPGKFLRNWGANMGRMVFSYPFSYRLQTPQTFLLLLPNTFVFVLTVLCVYPTVRARDRIPPELAMLLCFAAVAFGGTSLLAAYERQFRILVPILGVWIAFTCTRLLRIEVRAADADV